MRTCKNYTDEDFIKAVESSISIAQVLRKIGLIPAGGNYKTAKLKIKNLGLNTDHFLGQGYLKGKTHNWTKRPLEEHLCVGATCRSSHIRKRLIDEGLKENRCECCGLWDEWQNKKLVMHLDHINGDSTDNRLENLRILCPNCHSQTSTYCGRNNKK
ncbi:hypothetical protein LCGC14_3024400 [marine sediment metagenome]|uniref:HNH nuclease domain-containing protein n=1 Tax=marine sediment metagenome TaxID=412755 RepID=A0A0F8WUS7_9ZZZZ